MRRRVGKSNWKLAGAMAAIAIVAILFSIGVRHDLFELLIPWLRGWERWDADEMLLALSLFGLGAFGGLVCGMASKLLGSVRAMGWRKDEISREKLIRTIANYGSSAAGTAVFLVSLDPDVDEEMLEDFRWQLAWTLGEHRVRSLRIF